MHDRQGEILCLRTALAFELRKSMLRDNDQSACVGTLARKYCFNLSTGPAFDIDIAFTHGAQQCNSVLIRRFGEGGEQLLSLNVGSVRIDAYHDSPRTAGARLRSDCS